MTFRYFHNILKKKSYDVLLGAVNWKGDHDTDFTKTQNIIYKSNSGN